MARKKPASLFEALTERYERIAAAQCDTLDELGAKIRAREAEDEDVAPTWNELSGEGPQVLIIERQQKSRRGG